MRSDGSEDGLCIDDDQDIVQLWQDSFYERKWKSKKAPALLKYFGGKGHLAKKIVPLIPEGDVYVEPYCGASSVFFQLRDPFPVEVLNDLDKSLITTMRCFQREETFRKLAHRLIWTPYSLDEFKKAIEIRNSEKPSDLDLAWAVVVSQRMGMSGICKTGSDWSRAFVSTRGMAQTSSGWLNFLQNLRFFHRRLMRVQLDSRDALEVVQYWDSKETVFYLDPPYMEQTRKTLNVYHCEVEEDHHKKLIELLLELEGQFVLSGYDHPLYNTLEEHGCRKIEFQTSCHAAGRTRNSGLQEKGSVIAKVPRTEVIWIKTNGKQRIALKGLF